ncbi:MAG: flagellar basal-body MS-ring/collar protein FliF [Novosphingobium sp.]
MPAEDERKAQGRRQMILIAAGALALAGVIFLLWLLVLRTPMEPAFTKLKPADAALIVDELKRRKVPHRLENDGATILVPADQVDATRIGILGGDLPLKGTVGFELFSKSDMGLTEFAQKINYQRALQGELARTLMSLATVDSARVHITLPETGVFQEDHRPAKASVTITPKLGAVVDGNAVIGIQRLVASAVEDLDAANVVVLDSGGKQLSAEPNVAAAEGTRDGGDPVQAAKVRQVVTQLVTDPALRVAVVVPAKRADTPAAGTAHPIRVTLTFSVAPPPNLRDRAVPLLQGAIGFDAAAGDSLEIVQLPPSSPYQVGRPMASAVGRPAGALWDQDETPGLGLGWIAAAVLLAVGIAVLASPLARPMFRRRPPADFAARLGHLLDEDEARHG